MRDRTDLTRRSFIGSALAAAAGLAGSRLLQAQSVRPDSHWDPDDEPGEEVKRVLRMRFGDRSIRKGNVQLDVPVDAPDGRVVPVFIESPRLFTENDSVKAFHLIVDYNPDIYVAGFHFTRPLRTASMDTRIKMRKTSYVRAIAETRSGELWYAATKVFVTLNGCG